MYSYISEQTSMLWEREYGQKEISGEKPITKTFINSEWEFLESMQQGTLQG